MANRRWCALAEVGGQTRQYRISIRADDCIFDALFAFCGKFGLHMTQLRQVREVTQEELDLTLPAHQRAGTNW